MVRSGQGRSPLHDFIAHDSRHYAKKVTQDIVSRTDVLDGLPLIGRVVPELGDGAIRELSLYSYRIVYEVKADNAYILAVIHKRRDLRPDMIDR